LQPAGHVKILLSYVDGKCAGGLVLFGWGKNLVSKFAACLPHAVPLRAYAALYWRAIQLGIQLGYERLSWGTSSRDQTGLIEFKERWGAVTRPAVLYSLPVRGSIPDISKYYDSTGMERRIWRKLPIPLTQAGGRVLSRWFC
jgi:lipid II:glycine glycyltransferase (peptidoglycan interpeptide bridge formation enzyme)